MKIDAKVVVTPDAKFKIREQIDKKMSELELPYKIIEKDITITELTVEVDLKTKKVMEHIFNLVKAPEDEIKYLIKIKSMVVATAKDILNSVLKGLEL